MISTEVSHTSATEYPEDIKYYIETERKFAAIAGPYKEPPFGDNTHVSPFMSRPKPDSDKRRVIIDLSWPKNGSVKCQNVPNG